MKKFLFLISCLVLFGFAGCKHDQEPQKESYTISVINECSDPIIVWGGSISKVGNKWNWDNYKDGVFLESSSVLDPGDSVEITGELTSSEGFLIGGRNTKTNYSNGWAIDKRNKYVYFRDSVGYVGEGEEKKEQEQITPFSYTEAGERKEYKFTVLNNCDMDLTIAVGDFAKYNGIYEWSLYNWFAIHDKILVKAGKSIEIKGKLIESYVFGVDVWLTDENQTYKGGWYLDPHLGYVTLIFDNSNPDKAIKGFQLGEKKGKVENTGEADIYPLTIENGYTEPVIVCVGDVSMKGSGYDWNTARPYEFLNQILLNPGESIKVYGKITSGKVFYVDAWPLSLGGAGWAVPVNYDKVTFIKDEADTEEAKKYKITIKRENTSSGSSSSSQILLSTRNSYIPVSK